jgi:hypothetical protein
MPTSLPLKYDHIWQGGVQRVVEVPSKRFAAPECYSPIGPIAGHVPYQDLTCPVMAVLIRWITLKAAVARAQ